LKPNDVLLVLSAGNANEIIAALLSKVDQGLIEEGRS
jgi:hypothetical protein